MQIINVDNLYENAIDAYLLSFDQILDVEFLKDEKTAFVALKLKPIYLKSERDIIFNKIEKYLFNEGYEEILITEDIDLLYKSKNCNNQEDLSNLFKMARARYEHH